MKDPDATVVRQTAAVDPDATVLRPPAPAAGDAADQSIGRDPTTIVNPRRAEPGPAFHDATTVVMERPPQPAAATGGEHSHKRDDDSDATVVRNTIVRPRGSTSLADRTQPRGTTLRPLPKKSLALPSGMRLHEYRIERVLGQGGFGITYLATDINLDAEVAIKEYLPEEIAFRAGDRSVSPSASEHRDRYQQGLENFLTEARTLASFRHPNIVRVARFFEANRTAYMVLEYERGRSFKKWWLKQNQADGHGERLLAERLQPLLDGLETVHAAGYLHRDIKPDNIQVRAEDGRLVLLDFGSAGQTVALADQDAVVVTPGYAPLEQYGFGEQGAWTDIYALGATLYWAVAGHKPPDAEARSAGITMPSAVEAGKGRFGRNFLEAIDWALQMDAAARPRSVGPWRDKLLADHVSSLGLKEALRLEDTRLDGEQGVEDGSRWRVRLSHGWRRATSPSSWPLAAKLAVAMLFTALVPMLVTGWYNLSGAQHALEAAQLRKTELIAHNTAGRVGQLLQSSSRLARGLGGDADLARWLATPDDVARSSLQQQLQALAAANPDIQFLMLMDPAGGVRLSTDPELVGRNFAFREYFKAAMEGRSFNTGIIVGAGVGASGVFFAEPVRDAAGAVRGVAVLRVRASAFGAILAEVQHDSELTPFMIDGDGVVVHHPRAELMYRSLLPLGAEVQQRIKADQRFRRDRVDSIDEPALAAAMIGARQSGHVAYRSTVSGVDEIAGFAPVPGQRWTVGVSQTREAFEHPLNRLMMHLALSVALVGLVFTALALRFARSIVRPVQALTAGTQALKAGQFEQAYVDVKGRDELGQLARTFNVMVDVLRQRDREQGTRRR